MKFRKKRLGKLIREELGKIIARNVEFPGALVTITDVLMTDELDHAKIRFTVYPSEKSKEVFRVFKEQQWDIRREFMKKVHMRTMPQFDFILDHGNENAAAVEKKILGL